MTSRTYHVLFWSVLSLMVLVFAWYGYLFSRGLVTFSLGPTIDNTIIINSD
ncbi:MAG: hypothetical protein U0517_02505 [Candidatus Andersenbacteria bacterium]